MIPGTIDDKPLIGLLSLLIIFVSVFGVGFVLMMNMGSLERRWDKWRGR